MRASHLQISYLLHASLGRIDSRRDQRGFTMLEIALTMVLAGIVAVSYLYIQTNDTQTNLSKAQAGYYMTVNDAVGRYMLRYYDGLSGIRGQCSTVPLKDGATASGTSLPCAFATSVVSGPAAPANAYQPTLQNLKALGMLDANFADRFLFSTDKTVRNRAGGVAPSTYFVNIQRWCNNVQVVDETICLTPTFKSLVFNSQPFSTSTDGTFKMTRDEKLSTALSEIGSDGLMSLESTVDTIGNLFSVGKQTFLANPIGNAANKGIPGILAIQNSAAIQCSAQ